MSERSDPVAEAFARGDTASRVLIGYRDQLFEPMAALLLITGEAGLRACAAGVAEAVIAAARRRARGEQA